MADTNRDVVAGRIQLDTSKILPAFKVIDGGALKNAESFKALNKELLVSEKSYTSMAKAMDKLALTSDERRKKILDESNALVAQRTAAAALLAAKKSQLDATNQIVESKLQAQQAIQKKREDAIEQQEKEHLKRLETLQNRANTSGAQASRATGTDEAARERALQYEQRTRRAIANAEEQDHQTRLRNIQKEEAARERALQEEQRIRRRLEQTANNTSQTSSDSTTVLNRMGDALLRATLYQGAYAAIHQAQRALKEGLVDIEANMAGYVQTNEHYFVSFNEGTNEMVMDTKRLSEETTNFIHTAHDLGANILDVTESARLWGRMYKDVGVVQEMVRQSTKLSTVDLVGLQDATKMMEAVMAQYGVQIHSVNEAQMQGNRVLDSWSSVAHNTMAPAKELGAAFERTGKIASETGVSFDFMNGLISSGIRNTALGGANLGNMWKTVLGTIRTDKAVDELERLGVATKKTVDGAEEWRKAEDILLDLSIAVIDKNYDLTKSFQDISRGVFQFAKLAASMNVGDILLGESASINSSGSTMQYLKVQMDTIERKAAATRASLLEIFSTAGDDGLRKSIKDVLDVLDQLLIGLTKVPKGVYEVTAGLGALLIAYRVLSAPIMNLVTAVGVLTAAKTTETIAVNTNTAANEVNILSSQGATISTVQRTVATEGVIVATAGSTLATEAATVATVGMTTAQAAMSVTMGLATAGLSILAGIAMVWVYNSGQVEKAERETAQAMKDTMSTQQQMISQMQRQEEFVPKLVDAHNKLQAQYDKLTESAKSDTEASKKQIEIKGQLEKVSQALSATVKAEGLAQLQAAGYTAQAVKIQVDKIKEAREQLRLSNVQMAKSERDEIAKQMKAKAEQVSGDQEELSGWAGSSKLNPFRSRGIAVNKEQVEAGIKEVSKLEQKLLEKNAAIAEMESQPLIDKLAGEEGKRQREIEDIEKDFDAKRAQFTHLVNRKTEGYITAADQEKKLSEILSEYKDKLAGNEKIENLIDDISRTDAGHEFNAKGFGKDKADAAFKFPMNDIDNQIKQAQMLKESASSLIDFYQAKQGALSQGVDDTSQRIALYENRQNSLRDSNVTLRESLTQLEQKQNELDSLYKKGGVTLDEYNQQSEAVTSRIASVTKEVDANSVAWWNDAKAIKEAQEQALKDSFSFSEKWIAHEKATREMSAAEELAAWERVQAEYAEGTELRKQADEQVYAGRKAAINEEMSLSEKWISHQKGIGKLTPAKEIAAWERVQGRYLEGTEQRMKAEEQLYNLRKQAFQDEEKNIEEKNKKELDSLDKLVKAEKKYISEAKKAELERIDAAKKAYVEAQDAKIKAINDLIAADQEANSDSDYEKQLAEKKARAKLLEDAVGPEGKKERRDLLKEIEKMETDHSRDLRKRSLEDQKKTLEEEKKVREKAFDDQKAAAETHYQSLLDALDLYNNDAEGRAETLKQIQILKESEKNQEILKNLDTFIADYQSKMSKIIPTTSGSVTDSGTKEYAPTKTQKEMDLEEYNRNKDLWNQANADGDKARMADYNRRNEEIRKKYGIIEDNGKLQHFKDGGVVRGGRGQAVPVIAHAGEMYINEAQQSNLFKLLNFSMPQMNFSMPSFDIPRSTVQNITQHFDMSASNVNLTDQADIKSFYKERGNIVDRSLSRSGVKIR
ncbi:transglycosylase [Paenibacillus sp. WQ 127069]|uniref:Transglycosylase n=1 Tax=Paenibacillus baimaensis TaxID=2982185 RepID=A0ABT2UTM0_9BACL|nr:transglycosylase [Paenibacillus sp. WQ 127069]MCU6797995.1 transglycosylase [Paenibacillus sp. WQ 127069]